MSLQIWGGCTYISSVDSCQGRGWDKSTRLTTQLASLGSLIWWWLRVPENTTRTSTNAQALSQASARPLYGPRQSRSQSARSGGEFTAKGCTPHGTIMGGSFFLSFITFSGQIYLVLIGRFQICNLLTDLVVKQLSQHRGHYSQASRKREKQCPTIVSSADIALALLLPQTSILHAGYLGP